MTNRKSHTGYLTSKLTLASYLLASEKAELVGTEPLKSGKGVAFILSIAPSQDEVTAFYSGNATVSALRFAEAMNTLKSVAFESQRFLTTAGVRDKV